MANVYVEARPKGRSEGSHIEDYPYRGLYRRGARGSRPQDIQDPGRGDHLGEKSGALAPRSARPASERQENSGPLASGLGQSH